MPALYVSDLDGTLFDNTSRVSERSLAILNSLLAEGALFSVATARSAASGMEKLAGIHFTLPIALMNGVLLFNTATRTYVSHTSVCNQTAKTVLDIMDAFGQTAYVFTFAQNQLYANFKELTTPFQRQFCEERRSSGLKRFEQVDNLHSLLGLRDIIFFSITGARGELLPLYERLRGETSGLNVLMYEDFADHIWYLEVYDAHASKANALHLLRQLSGAEETVCFGDNYNDVDMMRAADRSYAVANAVEPVKQAATAVIGKNGDDAVAAFIQADFHSRCKKGTV